MYIKNKTEVKIGVVPTHLKFSDCLIPNEVGNLPRTRSGDLKVTSGMHELCRTSPVKIDIVQIPLFYGTNTNDIKDLFHGMNALKLEVQIIIVLGEVDPLDPNDEEMAIEILNSLIKIAKKYQVKHISSTSFEKWLSGKKIKDQDLDKAIKQLIKLHIRCYKENNLENSNIEAWHLEFLRGIEFSNFTNASKAGSVVMSINEKINHNFFKVLIDAAHCGDSDLSILKNKMVIKKLAENDALGIFHASAKTTRGCFSTDDGWIGALLSTYAVTEKLKYALVEIFHHEDPILETLRDSIKGHGVDTTNGRTYNRVVIDGIVELTHRINNLANRNLIR